MSHRVFLSSTFDDLKDHREYVIQELRKAGIDVEAMEMWGADPREPKEFSQDHIKGCDFIVLLVAYRRGYVPEPGGLSITQLEYRAAVQLGIDALVFLLKDDVPWLAKFDQRRDDPEIINWRDELKKRKGVSFFNEKPTSVQVLSSLAHFLLKEGSDGKPGFRPPYDEIWSSIRSGKVIPFLGAEASSIVRPKGMIWNPKQPECLPTNTELANFLANRANYPSHDPRDRGDLAIVSSYFAFASGRPQLRERLRGVLIPESRAFPYGGLHRFLAAVPIPQLILTTNYDTLIEDAFKAAEKPYDLVIYPAEYAESEYANALLLWRAGESEPLPMAAGELAGEIDLAKRTVILKMHGSVNRESEKRDQFVITEEDNVDLLSRILLNTAVPSFVYEHASNRRFLFLGYTLTEWNLRVILPNLTRLFSSKDEKNRLPSWAVRSNPSGLEWWLWQKKLNVTVFDMPLHDFVTELNECKEKECEVT